MHATTSPKAFDLKPALLAVLAATIVVAGIVIASAMDLRIGSTTAAVVAPDTSYDAVEGARAQFGVAPDTSYDAVEGIRAQSGVTVDTSLTGKSGYLSSKTHDELRAEGGWWASAPAAAPTQPERDGRFGAGYR